MKDIFDEIAPDVESAQPDVFDIAEQSFKPTSVVTPPVERVPAFVPQPPPRQESFLETMTSPRRWAESAGNAAGALAKGAVALGEGAVGLADIVTLGRAGKAMEDTFGYDPRGAKQSIADTLQTEDLRRQHKKVADAKGFVGTVKALLENPTVIADITGESLPSMFGGAAIAKGGMKLAPHLNRVVAVAGGEGAIAAGSLAEGIRQQTPDRVLTPKQASLAAAGGAATALLSVLGGKIAQRLGLEDVDVLLSGGASTAAKRNVLMRVLGGAVTEGALEEFPQSMQEAIAQNLALGKPWNDGVVEQGVLGMAAGLVTGGAGGLAGGRRGKSPKKDEDVFDQVEKQAVKQPEPAIINQAEIDSSLIVPKGDVVPPVVAAPAPTPLVADDDLSVKVTPPAEFRGKQLPGAVQVDSMPEGNQWSSNPEAMRQQGYDIPTAEELMQLPQGTYTLTEAKRKLKEIADEKVKPSPEVIAPSPLPVVEGKPVVIPPEGQAEVGVAQPASADQAVIPEAKAGTPLVEQKEPPAVPPPVLKGGDSGLVKPLPDVASVESNLVSNLGVSKPVASKLSGFLQNASSESGMKPDMLRLIFENPEIFRSIVSAIPINVVNDFAGQQWAVEDLLRNNSMLVELLLTNPNLPISQSIVSRIKDRLALLATKISDTDLRRLLLERNAAGIAGNEGGSPVFGNASKVGAKSILGSHDNQTLPAKGGKTRTNEAQEKVQGEEGILNVPAAVSPEAAVPVPPTETVTAKDIGPRLEAYVQLRLQGKKLNINSNKFLKNLKKARPEAYAQYQKRLEEQLEIKNPKPKASRRKGDLEAQGKRGWDLIDEAKTNIGKISWKLIKEANPNWFPVGAARKIFAADGEPADTAAQTLWESGHYKGDPGQVDQFGEAMNDAALGRKGNRAKQAKETRLLDEADRQRSEFEEDIAKQTKSTEPVILDDLQVVDKFTLNGHELKVIALEFDEDGRVESITLDDGKKYGTQQIGDTTTINTLRQDKGSLVKAGEADADWLTPEDEKAAEPTEAQKEAGNYKKKHVNLHGLEISIENEKGSQRTGTDKGGKPWSVTMPADYGYIRRTEGKDGDQLDVYVGENPQSPTVFIVDQINLETGRFDEHKSFIGFTSQQDVQTTYDSAFSDGKGPERRKSITAMTVDQFTDWIKNGDLTQPVEISKPAEKKVEPAKKFPEPKFKEGEKVMVGEYPMTREGTIAAFGPYKDGEQWYFVNTNLAREQPYRESDLKPVEPVKPAETFEQRMAREEDMNEWIKSARALKRPPESADEAWKQYSAFDRSRGVETPGEDYFKSAWESSKRASPEPKPESPAAFTPGQTVFYDGKKEGVIIRKQGPNAYLVRTTKTITDQDFTTGKVTSSNVRAEETWPTRKITAEKAKEEAEAPAEAAPAKPLPKFPAALAKRMLALSYERQTDAFGPSNESLRQDIIEAVHGKRPPKSKAGSNAVKVALANLFGIDSKSMAGVRVDDAIRAELQRIVAAETKAFKPEQVSPVEPAKQEAKFKAGDDILYVPKDRKQSEVSGIIVDVIHNQDGEVGYNVLSPLPGDPGRQIRIWAKNAQAIAIATGKESSLPEGITITRDKDFVTTGNYTVTDGTNTDKIFRDPENKWWYSMADFDAASKTAFPATPLSTETRADAIQKLVERWQAEDAEKPAAPVEPKPKPAKRDFPSFSLKDLKEEIEKDNASSNKLNPEMRKRIEDEIAARESGASQIRVTPQIVSPNPEAKPADKLSPKQLKRLSELVKLQRAADEGGTALTPAERKELDDLRSVGQEDLLAEPTGANEAAKRAEAARLRAKAEELLRQSGFALDRYHASKVQEVAAGHRDAANKLAQEAAAARAEADQIERELRGEKPQKKAAQDDLFANLGTGMAEGTGWDEAGIRGAIAGEDTAGFKVNVISSEEAERVTGRPEARGYGGFFYQGQVYLVANNIGKNNTEGARRLLREEVGHGLLRTKEGLQLLTEVIEAGKINLTEAEKQALRDQGYNENQFLDEFIAKSARENRSWWKDLVARIVRFLKGKGFDATNEEAARLLLRQIKAQLSNQEVVGVTLAELAPGRPEPLKQAVEMFGRKAEVDPAEARRAVEIGQASNVLARQGMARGTLENLESIARGEATTPQQKWFRDLARKVLSNPFIRNALRRPVERLNASAQFTDGTIESYQTLKAKADATPEQVSNAAGEAVNDIVSWEQRVSEFNNAYMAKRQALTDGIAKTTEAEMEAYDKLDAADVLMRDFRSMALPILQQSNDTTALQAYTYALGRTQAVRNVLAWVGREVDLTGASTPADVLRLIREAGGRSRIQENIEQQIGAERGVIQAVARIIALVEPIRERLLEARFLYRQQAGTRSTELKQRLERLVAQGSYARALEVFERGAEKLGAEQDRARRELDFYARRTRQQLLALRALDEVKAISEQITDDPEFQAEKREIFGESAQNVRNVMVDIRGSTFVLKPFGGMTEELHLTFGNPTAESRASLEKIKAYRDRAMAYIASEDADPSVAQGLKATFPLLEQFLNPAVSPEAERLLPNFMLKTFHALLRRFGAPERIPYYLLQGAGGTWKALADSTLRARRDMGEQLQRINKAYFPKMSLALHAALKSHGSITPDTYFEKVWNHLAGSRQNFRDIRYLSEGDPIGNGEKVTKEDLAFLEAYRKFHTDLSSTSQNIGKRSFSSFRSVLTGIFFDKDGRVRLPFAQGVDMVNRRQPPQYEIEDWLNKWRAAKTPDAKSSFLTDKLDRLVIGYLHGVNQADWIRKFRYSYEGQLREVLAESGEQPIDSFETLVDRVFEKVAADENEESEEGMAAPTWEDVRNNLLSDFDNIFRKLERLDTTQKQTDPKNIVETVRSEREFNTERGDVTMPPNWYDYGGTTEAQWSSVSRASMFPYERAHLIAVNGIKDALSAVVKDFEQQAKSGGGGFRKHFRTKRESRKARERGELIYSWSDAKELLDKVTHYAAGLKMMAEQPQLLTQTDRPYAVLQSGITQLPVAMVLFRLGAASRNLFGGYTNAALADMVHRDRSWVISIPARAVELVSDTYKNVLALLAHEGNPVGRKMHALLSDASSRAVIGPMAEHFLKAIDEQRQIYREAAELGLNLNVSLWDSLSTLRKFARTGGNVREPGSPLESLYSVPAAALRMGGLVMGQAGVGRIDSWINTKAYTQARQYEQLYKKMARKYGEQMLALEQGQFPSGAFGGDYKAVKVREFFTRMAGIDIDAAMLDYYRRWNDAGAEGDTIPLFTEEQRNTLMLAVADDFNLATYSNRPYSTKMHSMLNTLGLFYGYPDWWIHKLLSTANLNSRKGLVAGRLENMPFLLNYAFLFALASIIGMEGVEWLKEHLLNQKSAYPTLTDAKTAPAAVRAAAGAVAFNTPFIGGAISSAFDLGYHGSNNPYDLFFIPGMLKAAANVGIETWQTGEPIIPLTKFADRYLLPFPSHKLTDRTAGNRAMVNTGNILEMSARAHNDEEKLKPRDTAGFDREHTPASPIITRAMNAIGNGDMPEFQKEYNALVEEYRKQGKADPVRNARQSLMTRNPVSQRFDKRPTDAEFAKYLSGLTETERKIVTETLQNYRQAMGLIGASPSFTTGEMRSAAPSSSQQAVSGAGIASGASALPRASRVRSAVSTSRRAYSPRIRGVRTRLTRISRRSPRAGRVRVTRVRRTKLPKFSTRIRRPRRIRISPRPQFV